MLPGLRAEYEALDIRSQGLRVTPDALRLYPTLHLSHDLCKGKVTLSYSRRVDRPNLTQYDPARTYQNLVYASQGNPDLKPPETDSYEAGYAYSQGKVSYDATLYYRALTNAVSDLYQDLGTGVTLDRQVNSGHSRSAGSEFTAKTPISKHWKVSVNLNVFYNEVPLLSGATQQSRGNVTYSSNSTLEYDADKGDQLQMAFAVTGRQLTAQGYNSQTSHLDLTWRHNLTKKLALVVNAQDVLLGNKQTIVYQTSDLRTRSFQPAFDRLIRVGLTRTFGGPAGK
jgi:outer membrane receptor for ferrienterochelin and colicin